MRRLAALTLVVSLLGCRDSSVELINSRHIPAIKGFTYTSFSADGFTLGSERNAVSDLQSQTGCTWIALTVFEYQDSSSSTNIEPNTTGVNPLTHRPWSTTSTMDDIRTGIREARSRNMNIMLKPHVDLYSGQWRAAILPDHDGKWFASYSTMLMKYARLAAESNIEILCIGTELVRATQRQFTAQWRTLISTIRRQYHGKLVYASNWSGAFDYGINWPEYDQVEFWNELDYIGIDAYYPLTDHRDDPQPSFAAALMKLRAPSAAFRILSARFGKPILITEIGIQSVKGALAAPWDYSIGASNASADNSVQDFYYRAIITGFGSEPWCTGVFWWNWESVVSPNESTNYTPRNKRAAITLKKWYTNSAL